MKSIFYGLLSLLVIFTAIFVGINKVNANGVTTQTLYADHNIPVGEVQVWNDEDTLFVKYLITESGWEMTKSNLYVGELGDLPKTKKGYPILAQFPYKTIHDPAVTTYTYEIDEDDNALGIDIDDIDEIVIAANATLRHTSFVTIKPDVTWKRSKESKVMNTPGYGGTWNYTGVIGNFTKMNAIVWDNSLYDTINNPAIVGVKYASWIYKANNGGNYNQNSDLRLFRANFKIPANFTVTSAKFGVKGFDNRLPINDNAYVYANGDLVFWGGTRATTIGTHEGMAGIQAIGNGSGVQKETDGWYIPGDFPSITSLVSGKNKIEVFTEENERWGGMGKLVLRLSGNLVERESAWADGIKISRCHDSVGKYFVYEWIDLEDCTVMDTVTVNADGTPVSSLFVLADEEDYRLEASGTYRFVDWGDQGIADAKYSYRSVGYIPDGFGYDLAIPQWVDGANLPGAWANYLQIWIDDNPANWVGDYNEEHIYTKDVTGEGNTLSFKIVDNAYGDNDGTLTVKICSLNNLSILN